MKEKSTYKTQVVMTVLVSSHLLFLVKTSICVKREHLCASCQSSERPEGKARYGPVNPHPNVFFPKKLINSKGCVFSELVCSRDRTAGIQKVLSGKA